MRFQRTPPPSHPLPRAVDPQDIMTDTVEFKSFDLSTVRKEELEFSTDFTLTLSAGKGGSSLAPHPAAARR